MAKLQPWHKIITPREDLRDGKPLDAAEFAVHLDKVRTGQAPLDYGKPDRFFDRTYLTGTLCDMAAQVVRRLSGKVTETSAVFNMATQFGGGKTHALALLYHLTKGGASANKWQGVPKILEQAGITSVPDNCAVAVFVGTEFDSLVGRGGKDGTPFRRTPWGEIAFQLGGEDAFSIVSKHDEQFIEPKGDVIDAFIPKDRPCLILMDEIINYVSTYRDQGYHNKLYNFVHALSETIRGRDNTALVVSIPKSELNYTDRDEQDQQRFKNMLDRLGKAVVMSVEAETAEIIRRRLFEWEPKAVSQEGKVLLSKDAVAACREYASWTQEHRQQIPQWFPIDHAQSVYEATYPFHPAVLSVFERKWQEMPRFQQTRGILRLLALWVSEAYSESWKSNRADTMIGLGSAPLDNPLFRTALLEQLGEQRLEGVITTDICGKRESHAVRLDAEATDTIKKAQLHKRIATAIFFESNGGQARNEASVPEVRLASSDPDLDIGNVETVLDALYSSCYYLEAKGNQYRFTTKENLNKRFADRSANVNSTHIEESVREEIQKAFPGMDGLEQVFFPEKSGQIQDRPVVTMVIMPPDQSGQNNSMLFQQVEKMTREHGQSARTYKNALIWVVPDSSSFLANEARKLLAWEDIQNEALSLDEAQARQLDLSLKKANRDLREAVWRTYNKIMLLGADNTLRTIDLGMPTSSAAESMTRYVINVLRQSDEIETDSPSPRLLLKNWPPTLVEWSTKSVRDAFFASPLFPRLLNPLAVKATIARGAEEGLLAYVGKLPSGEYDPFVYKNPFASADVEISDDTYVIKGEEAERHLTPPVLTKLVLEPAQAQLKSGTKQTFVAKGLDQHDREIDTGPIEWTATGGEVGKDGVFEAGEHEGGFFVTASAGDISQMASVNIAKQLELVPPKQQELSKQRRSLVWSGEVAPQKWMNFYTKVLTKYVQSGELKIRITFEANPSGGVTEQQIEETKAALRELGLNDDLNQQD